uniref:NADH-ubiquinone oxidoreductase chain 4 n=1 Tax=Hystrichopsylla weida qinlingensis TaxID=2583743 RepID=A0A4P9JMH5_9NEOP|nr:NADH dehydrogenase subunit 4 [Hystrichopsylla weida qinlingensis]QCU82656.1 NADH dehydrogenase subunit 4 [Hystrichopsylla weida qinlingensis]
MLSILMMLMFMIPLCFMKYMYWMVQMNMFLIMWTFMIMGMSSMNWYNMSYFMGYDLISYGMVLLSLWICCLMLMASEMIYKMKNFINLFMFMVVLLMLLLLLTFSSMNYFMFYLFFEGSLIPTLLLILGWGYQPERLQAGMYLMFYTLFASLPLLLSMMFLYKGMNHLYIPLMNNLNLENYLIYFFLIMAFLFKMPMYIVHLWLPKAHVEAPISGSMILAGVLLKLGGYGLLRVFPMLMNMVKFNSFMMSVSMLGASMVGFICLMQSDMKSLIAYSSVVHMGMVLGGIFTMSSWGLEGAYILMIAHGLCSSGMFCLANICYERLGSRSLLVNKGLLNIMPSMALFWFLLSSSNMAAPPSINLLGEIWLINSLLSWSIYMMLVIGVMSFISAAYSLFLFSYSQHGMNYSGMYSCSSGMIREFLLLFLHWFPLNLLIMKSDQLIMMF